MENQSREKRGGRDTEKERWQGHGEYIVVCRVHGFAVEDAEVWGKRQVVLTTPPI